MLPCHKLPETFANGTVSDKMWQVEYVTMSSLITMSQEPSLRYFSPCWKISWWLHQSTSHLHWQTSIECQHCSVVTMLSHSKQLDPTLSAAVMIYIMIDHRSWHRSKPRELSFSSVAVQSALFLLLMPWRLTAAYMSMWCQCNYPSYPNTARYTYLTLLNQVLFTVNFCSYTVYTSSDVKWPRSVRFWSVDSGEMLKVFTDSSQSLRDESTGETRETHCAPCEKCVKNM